MTTKTKIENAIDYIAKQGVARTDEIGEAIGEHKYKVAGLLAYAVKTGVLVSCRVERPGKKPCNEYRISGGGKPVNFGDLPPQKASSKSKRSPVSTPRSETLPNSHPRTEQVVRRGKLLTGEEARPLQNESMKEMRKLPPAPTPADRPQVSVNNSGSTQVVPPATGRAVTDKKPHRKASQPAPGAGGHVDQEASWALHSDGRLVIYMGGDAIDLTAKDAMRLAAFLECCYSALGEEPA